MGKQQAIVVMGGYVVMQARFIAGKHCPSLESHFIHKSSIKNSAEHVILEVGIQKGG